MYMASGITISWARNTHRPSNTLFISHYYDIRYFFLHCRPGFRYYFRFVYRTTWQCISGGILRRRGRNKLHSPSLPTRSLKIYFYFVLYYFWFWKYASFCIFHLSSSHYIGMIQSRILWCLLNDRSEGNAH